MIEVVDVDRVCGICHTEDPDKQRILEGDTCTEKPLDLLQLRIAGM